MMGKFARSVRHAVHGIGHALRHERNFRLEVVAAIAVFVLMNLLPTTGSEKSLLIFAVIVVLSFELINTAAEFLVDIVKPGVHPYARIVKDTMAAAVLIVSLGAAAVGWMIFWPYVSALM